MEKHPVTNICRLCAVFIIVALTGTAARANSLLNPGFETLGSNATTAASWLQFGNAALSSTNNTFVTVRTGLNSMQTGNNGSTNGLTGSGAEQDVSAASGDKWRLTGYLLTWINDRLIGPDSYGVAQLVFVDSGSNVLLTVESPHFGTDANMPVNVWQPFEIDATAPAGTVTVRTYVMYIGQSAPNQQVDGGSIFYDDLNLYKPSNLGSPSAGTIISSNPAVQVSWPTSSRTNGFDYQVQSNPSLVFSNPPAINVLTNGGFETNAAPWFAFNGGGQQTVAFAHTGTGVMKLAHNGSTVPGAFQTYSGIAQGQVWDLSGYGYNNSAAPINYANTRALIKIVWLDISGASLQAVPAANDPNLVGTVDSSANPGVVGTPQMSSASPQNQWIFLEARGTAPTNATQLQAFCLLVPIGATLTETAYFDDMVAAQPVSFAGWANFGALWIGNSHTNQVFDTMSTNKTKFYRVTTP